MTRFVSSLAPTLLLHGHPGANNDDSVQFGYPMKPGETLDQIAANLQIPLGDLLADNPGLQPGMLLQPGLEISVPNQYLGQIVGNPALFVASSAGNDPSGFTASSLDASGFLNPNSATYGTNGYNANVVLPNSGVADSNASGFALGSNPAANLGLPGSYFGSDANDTSSLSQVLFGSSTSGAGGDPFDLFDPLSFLLPQQATPAGYGSLPSWLGALDPGGDAPPPSLSFAQVAGFVAQTLQPSAGSPPAVSSITAWAVQTALANGPAGTTGTAPAAVNGTAQAAAGANASAGNQAALASNNAAQQAAAAARSGSPGASGQPGEENNVTVPNTVQAANAARSAQTQRDPELPPPPPNPPVAGNRFYAFATTAPVQNAATQPGIVSAWNVVAGAASGGSQAKLEIMALLATQAAAGMAGGPGPAAANGQPPGFIDPQALAAYAAAMRGGRTISLGGGRSLQFNVVADRLGRINAIGEEERGTANGTRRTGDGLDGVAQDDELAAADEKAQERQEERNRERRRLASVAAMRRRRRPLSTRCRYRQGERRSLREPGCGRYPRGVDLAEFSSRLPPRYLWTAAPSQGRGKPDEG